MMRLFLLAILVLIPSAAWAQRFKLQFPFAEQTVRAPAGIRPGHMGRTFPRVWGWGGGWWGNPGPLRVIVEQAPEPEKPAPRYVFNKEFVTEKLAPRMTEIASAPAGAPQAEWRGCSIQLTSGEVFDNAACAEVDDSVLVRSQSGRRYRFSRDLIAILGQSRSSQ